MGCKARNPWEKGTYRKGEDDEKRSSSPIRGPAAPPRSSLPRLILYQMYTQQLEQPICSYVFQEVADYAILAHGVLDERGESNFKTRLFHELEQLALGCTGIAKQQDVDITS